MIALRVGRGGSVTVHQDVALYAARFDVGQSASFDLAPERHGWIQIVRGAVGVNGEDLLAGDGAAVSGGGSLELRASTDSEQLLFDLQ